MKYSRVRFHAGWNEFYCRKCNLSNYRLTETDYHPKINMKQHNKIQNNTKALEHLTN